MQATYSPLQGTIRQGRTAVATTDTDLQSDLTYDKDLHRIWLDAFVFSPLPALVVVRIHDGHGHQILLANSAAVMMTGRDKGKLQMDTLESWIGTDSGTMQQLPRSFESGCEFTMPITGVDETQSSQSHLVAMPVCGTAGAGNIGYLVLFLQGPGAQQLCGDKLAAVPSVDDLARSGYDLDRLVDSKTIRKGLLTLSSSTSASAGWTEMQSAQWALKSAYDAAAARRDEGRRPLTALPAALDPVAWLDTFELCLTSTMRAE